MPQLSDPTDLQTQLDANRQRVDVDHYDLSISELLRMASDSELSIAPVYQRHFRWNAAAESSLIESLFLGLPVPSLYVATNPDATWEVVDGLQRLSTVMHFVAEPEGVLALSGRDGPLVLEGLQELSAFNGYTFSGLPGPMRLASTRRALRVTALSDKSDYQARFDLFERLNRGGVLLTAQEVRASIFRGEFNDLLRDLAKDATFSELVKLQRGHQNDGTREELALKFFAYYYDRDDFRGAVTRFLNDYMAKARESIDVDEARTTFSEMVETVAELTGGSAFLRSRVSTTPLNQFEAVMVAVAELLDEGKTVAPSDPNWRDDEELVRASTGATNTRTMLRARIERAKTLLST